jgi:hypothetical protein
MNNIIKTVLSGLEIAEILCFDLLRVVIAQAKADIHKISMNQKLYLTFYLR